MSHPYHGLNELREMFLSFFESKGHLRLPSFSLVPQNDKSILLINAGMTPMKPWFKGEEEPPRRRAAKSVMSTSAVTPAKGKSICRKQANCPLRGSLVMSIS